MLPNIASITSAQPEKRTSGHILLRPRRERDAECTAPCGRKGTTWAVVLNSEAIMLSIPVGSAVHPSRKS